MHPLLQTRSLFGKGGNLDPLFSGKRISRTRKKGVSLRRFCVSKRTPKDSICKCIRSHSTQTRALPQLMRFNPNGPGWSQRPQPEGSLDMSQRFKNPSRLCAEEQRPPDTNYVLLLRGTSEESTRHIVHQGFDERLTRRNLIGGGVYPTDRGCTVALTNTNCRTQSDVTHGACQHLIMSSVPQIRLGTLSAWPADTCCETRMTIN